MRRLFAEVVERREGLLKEWGDSMADLSEEQLSRAEARGRKMIETEPRATAAHYDPAAGRVVIELANGCTYAFPAQRVQDLQGASEEDLANVEVDGAGFNLHWPKLDVDLSVPALVAGVFGHSRLDRARVGSRRRPGEIAREGGGGPLQRGQRGAAAQSGEGLTITCRTVSVHRPGRRMGGGELLPDFWRDVDQWRPG